MSKLEWDAAGSRWYETGVDHGVLYIANTTGGYENGVAWNGLMTVTESPDGADVTDFWADNIKYASMRAAENYKGSIEAYMFPPEFGACDGTAQLVKGVTIGQQKRKAFGLCYRTMVKNDVGTEGYKLHIVYNATVSPSEQSHETVNDSPDAGTFSWDFETTPVTVTGHQATACLTIDSREIEQSKLAQLEDKLYGTDSAEPTLLTPNEILALIGA